MMLGELYTMVYEPCQVVGSCNVFRDIDEYNECNSTLQSPNNVMCKWKYEQGVGFRCAVEEQGKRLVSGLAPRGYADALDVQREGALLLTYYIKRRLSIKKRRLAVVKFPHLPRATWDLLIDNSFGPARRGEYASLISALCSLHS